MQVLNAKSAKVFTQLLKKHTKLQKNALYVPEKLDKRDHSIRLDANDCW